MFNFFRRKMRPPVDLILMGIKDGSLTVSRVHTINTEGVYTLAISRDVQGLPRIHITIAQHTETCWGMETGPSISYKSSEEWMTYAERVKIFGEAVKRSESDSKKLKVIEYEDKRLSLLRDLTAHKVVL